MNTSKSRKIVLGIYVIAFAIAGFLTYYLDSSDPISKLFFIDVIMTVVVYLFSVKYGNASIYDPYWSVIPFGMIFYYLYIFGIDVISLKVILASFAISFWSWRLTGNWLRGWKDMSHEDWRYVNLREKTGKWYLLVNFLGIHMFPTMVVFMAAIPIYYIFLFSNEMNIISWIGFGIAIGGTILEMTADNQLHKFKQQTTNSMAVCRTGVWRYMRHPNYSGEILFWLGLCLMAYTPYVSYSIAVGVLLLALMFLVISIPMIDKKLLKSKPEYTIYKESTWSIFPKFK